MSTEVQSPHAPQKQANEDATLGARIRQGDRDAFERVFRRYYEPLCRYSQGYVGSIAAAEDVVQGLFVQLWEQRVRWNPDSIRNYLYTAVRNRSINAVKRSERQVVFSREVASPVVKVPADGKVKYEELRYRVRQALTQLSVRQREVFYLSRNADLSHQEIARVLGLSVNTVATHMARALQKLEEQIEGHRVESR